MFIITNIGFSFSEPGVISGMMSEITPELTMRLGSAAAEVSPRIAVACSPSAVCRVLLNSFCAGAVSCGARITEVDAEFFAEFCHISRKHSFDLAVFIENDRGSLRIRLSDKFGLPISRALSREIESANDKHCNWSDSEITAPNGIFGAHDAYAESLSDGLDLRGLRISVDGKGRSAETLRRALFLSGAVLTSSSENVPVLSVSQDGMLLQLRDEGFLWHDSAHAQAILAFIHFLSGGRELAVFPFTPGIIEQIAGEFGGQILRIGRDDRARDVFVSQNSFRDALEGGMLLCSYLAETGEALSSLSVNIPDFTLISREISLKGDRGNVLNALAKTPDGLHKESVGCLRICADGGWVSISPSRSRSSLRITGEGMSEEIASELCNLFVEKARALDTSRQK